MNQHLRRSVLRRILQAGQAERAGRRARAAFPLFATLAVIVLLFAVLAARAPRAAAAAETTTPIKHVIILFQENRSFDHYFGTYPNALNPPGEPRFKPAPGTPAVDGLTPELLHDNPNSSNPFRLPRSISMTCSPLHTYRSTQRAYNGGRLDKFVEALRPKGAACDPKLVMGYYDGNTVTALWNYAQHFALSDSFFASVFGASTPGALNLISGQTHGATPPDIYTHNKRTTRAGTVIGDPRPFFDVCGSRSRGKVSMRGRNIGDLLNAKGVTWGHFQGGFTPSERRDDGTVLCRSAHEPIAGRGEQDYAAHHAPFQYYASTANPYHLPPTSVAMIGKTDQANHQYDLVDFWAAVEAGNLPAVSFLRAARFQDGHPYNSHPLDEQAFLVGTINRLVNTPMWSDMAIFIFYDDGGGWYDHVMPPIVVPSNDERYDVLFGYGRCGEPEEGAYPLRCGFGPRLPFLLVSPYAKVNTVDHTVLNHASILRFIEDNWDLGRIGDQSIDKISLSPTDMFDFESGPCADAILLDPETGLVSEVRPGRCD